MTAEAKFFWARVAKRFGDVRRLGSVKVFNQSLDPKDPTGCITWPVTTGVAAAADPPSALRKQRLTFRAALKTSAVVGLSESRQRRQRRGTAALLLLATDPWSDTVTAHDEWRWRDHPT